MKEREKDEKKEICNGYYLEVDLQGEIGRAGGVLKNKARLVERGYRQEEGIDFEESFDPVARLKAIHIYNAFTTHMNMVVYQMNVKTVFLNGILREESKYALESIKKYGMETCEPTETPKVEKSKLDEDLQGKAVDPKRYRKMIGTLMYLTANRPDLVFVVCMYARMLCSNTLDAITLTNYGLVFNKIPPYYDNKSGIDLCCKNVQHTQSKHINIKHHFIKEQVKNGVVELYFVIIEYQLADIFTKPLARERLEFLIKAWNAKHVPGDSKKASGRRGRVMV
nr:hypothetical protein [Tanacetum cinerariifolium]